MATAEKINEMSRKFNILKQDLVPVEGFFEEYLTRWIFEKTDKGEMPEINLFRDFELIMVSSTHAIFFAPEETVCNRNTSEVEHVLSANVSVPLIYMAKAVK